jgi:multiple sugar transport system permease protein
MESARGTTSVIAELRRGPARLDWIYYATLLTAWLVPGLVLLLASFIALDASVPSELYRFLGVHNFSNALGSVDFWWAAARTFGLVIAVTAASSLFAACITANLLRLRPAAARLMLMIISLPLFLPPITTALIWHFQLSPDYGPVGYWLYRGLGITAFSTRAAFLFIILIEIWRNTPLFVVLYFVGLKGLQQSLIDTQRLFRPPIGYLVMNLLIPKYKGLMLFSILLGAISVSKSFESIFITTRGGPGSSTEVLNLFVHKVIFERFNLGVGAAYAVIYDVALVAIFWVLFRRARAI